MQEVDDSRMDGSLPKKRYTLDYRGAMRIVEGHLAGRPRWELAAAQGVSTSTVKRVVKYYKRTGEVRVPRQGIGKANDPRWIYRGPNGPGNLRALEWAHNAGDCADFCTEVIHRHHNQGLCTPGYSTMTKALRTDLDMSSKVKNNFAPKRDAARCEQWMDRMNRQYRSDQLVMIDET